MARKKKKLVKDLLIESYAAEGKSIARLEDGKVVFIEKVVPGDRAEVLITRQKTSYAQGISLKITAFSPDRVAPFCDHFGICGGCKWQMLPYGMQLKYKQQQVQDQLCRISKAELPEMMPILGSEEQRFYRNKLEYTFSNSRYLSAEEIKEADGKPLAKEKALGFHAPGLFDKVVPVEFCHLQPEPSNTILNFLREYSEKHDLDYYDFREQDGWLRNVIIRVTTTGQTLVNLVVKTKNAGLFALLDEMQERIPEITSLHYTINPKMNDSLYDLDVIHYKGTPWIEERLENFTFKISPKSFFQTNTKQAENLYNVVRDFAELQQGDTLYDLYCGAGSIGIYCSKNAGTIIGIETIAEAIEDAKENAERNKLDNCHFYAGDVTDICNEAFFKKHGKPDVVITDPPRAGMSEKLVKELLQLEAPRIVYVSCNPATQARDLALLKEKYRVTAIQPVDMFPHTHHIENVMRLELITTKTEDL